MEFPQLYVQRKDSLLHVRFQTTLRIRILAGKRNENDEGTYERHRKNSMFSLGKITKISDLPSKHQLKAAIKEAMELTDMGVTIKKSAPKKTEIETPNYFLQALNSNKKAKEVFDKSSPSFRKEYIMWITEAKTESTRNKRLGQAIEWISEGKCRNWKYEKC